MKRAIMRVDRWHLAEPFQDHKPKQTLFLFQNSNHSPENTVQLLFEQKIKHHFGDNLAKPREPNSRLSGCCAQIQVESFRQEALKFRVLMKSLCTNKLLAILFIKERQMESLQWRQNSDIKKASKVQTLKFRAHLMEEKAPRPLQVCRKLILIIALTSLLIALKELAT